MSTKLDRLSELAKEDGKRQFFSIAHLITPEALSAAFRGLRKEASTGVDGVRYEDYEKDAARNIQQLHQRLKDGKYQAQPLRRVYIPKEEGKQRPISIPALEDKILQKAMVEVLNAIYEQAFSRLLLRVSTWTGTTPSVGRSGTGDLHPAHGMESWRLILLPTSTRS